MTGESLADAFTARRQKTPGPRRRWVGFAQTAERADKIREARPAKASEFAVLEPADDGLVDAAEMLELSLGDRELLTPAAHQPTDQFEPAAREWVHLPDHKRVPGHARTMAGSTYLAIIYQSSCARAGEDPAPAMHVECIGRPNEVPAARLSEGPAARLRLRRTRPEPRPMERAVAQPTVQRARSMGQLMHSSCIGTKGSRRPDSGAGAPPTCLAPGEVA